MAIRIMEAGFRSFGYKRIGLAVSPDLINWEKHPGNPIIVSDPRFYEEFDQSIWHEEAWRDPWVFQHPVTGIWHVFLTARINHGPMDGRGYIAHGRSEDLINREVLRPVAAQGDFSQMEVPQLVSIGGNDYLLFPVSGDVLSKNYRERSGKDFVAGTHYMVSENPLGPYQYQSDGFLVGDVPGSYYSGKIARNPVGELVFLAYHHYAKNSNYLGELGDPIPVIIGDSSGLKLN